jgi:preprotein translocase subunit SecA
VIYADRRLALEGGDVSEYLNTMIHEELAAVAEQYMADDYADNWDASGLLKALAAVYPLPAHFNEDYVRSQKKADFIQEVIDEADLAYEAREERFGPEIMRQAERFFLLSIVDRRWVQHIDALDELREGVQLQAAGQRDPLVVFRTTAAQMFTELKETIRHEVVHVIYQFDVQIQQAPPPMAPPPGPTPATVAAAPNGGTPVAAAQAAQPRVVRSGPPSRTVTTMGAPRPMSVKGVGRNDPCPCGSGRKYKQCHGRG